MAHKFAVIPRLSQFDSELTLIRIDEDHSDPWACWEHCDDTIHRGVIHWWPDAPQLKKLRLRHGSPYRGSSGVQDDLVARTVRRQISRNYDIDPQWGFGFGVIVELPGDAWGHRDLGEYVDSFDDRTGSWQWLIVVMHQLRKARAMHTWIPGYTHEVYEGVIETLRAHGYTATTRVKERRPG